MLNAQTAQLLVSAVALAAILYLLWRKVVSEAPNEPRRKGAKTPDSAPGDTPATASKQEVDLLKRVMALETKLEAFEERQTNLTESMNRRFGRLNAATRRGHLPEVDDDDSEDPAQVPLFPPKAPERSPSEPRRFNGHHRPLMPRR